MDTARLVIFVALGLITAAFVGYWAVAVRRSAGDTSPAGPGRGVVPSAFETLVGFVTNFFDTLGIGSFASTTSVYKLHGTMTDERIPGTLNIGHTLPTVVQAYIFIAAVQVAPKTLVAMILASVLGAWLGAPIVCNLPRRKVQIGMGVALVVAATLFALTNLKLLPGGGSALALDGTRFWIGVVANFALGALMTLGIGLYGPCMILVSLLGMSPLAAFPIMMGSCAFLMPIGSIRFIERRSYALRPALGLALGGVPAVLAAVYLVTRKLPIETIRWGVVVVVLYTAGAMLYSAFRRPQPDREVGAGAIPPSAPPDKVYP